MYYFTDDCLIGIETIDNEHRELFRLVNEMESLLENKMIEDKYDHTREMVERLKNYAQEHFRHEEEYMAKIRHPELELQKKQHADFCAKVNEADTMLPSNGQEEFLHDLLKFLVTWLYRHIIGSDLMIGKLKPLDEPYEVPAFVNNYLTGIPLIDKEHQELFRIIGECQQLIFNEFIPDKYDDIVSLLTQLRNYTKVHFDDEEAYMKEINYKGLPAQKRAHDAFAARLDAMDLEHIDNNQQETLEELMEFLTEWLINHILNSDKQIGR